MTNAAHNHKETAEDRALERFTEMMIDRVKEIQTDWKKPWLSEQAAIWPRNLSGREYSGMNALMLMMHCEKEGYRLPVFLTFDRIVGLNYGTDPQGQKNRLRNNEGNNLPQVTLKKGSKSFPVFITTFTCVDPQTRERIRYDDYKEMDAEERKRYNVYPKLQVYNVFNIDQTNIQEARPELYGKLLDRNCVAKPVMEDGERFSFAPLDRMIRDDSWFCPIREVKGDDAYYSISKDEIVIPLRTEFIDGESFVSNTFHEMTHSLGAESRLNRLKPSSFGSKDYAREELCAELTAAAVSSRYGITKHIKEDSAAYLRSWLESLQESPDFLKTVLMDVKKSSALMCQRINEIQQEIDKDAAAGLPCYQFGDYAAVGEAIQAHREEICKGLQEHGMHVLSSVTLVEASGERRLEADIRLTGNSLQAVPQNLRVCSPGTEPCTADSMLATLRQAGLTLFDVPSQTMEDAMKGRPSAQMEIGGTLQRLSLQKDICQEYDLKIMPVKAKAIDPEMMDVMEGVSA